MANIFKNKKINLKRLSLYALCALNLALFLVFIIFDLVNSGEAEFYNHGFNNFLMYFTYICNAVFCVYHLLLLFWKKKSTSILYISASAGFIAFFYVLRLFILWL